MAAVGMLLPEVVAVAVMLMVGKLAFDGTRASANHQADWEL